MRRERNVVLGVIGILVLTILAGIVVVPQGPNIRLGSTFVPLRLRLGLDLLGGTQLTYGADMREIPPADQADALEGVREVIERRVNPFGIAERLVQTTGRGERGRILVELPGVQDAEEAIRIIGETPQLDFREEAAPDAEEAKQETPPTRLEDVWTVTSLTGRQLKRADVSFHPQTGAPEVVLAFDDEGRKLFAELTKKNVGKRIAIFLDGAPITAPVVQDVITEGTAVITGNFTLEEAKQLAQRLRAGALPVPISLESRTTVGPSLGRDSLNRSVVGGMIGLAFVAVFMVVLYRLPGVIAAIALLLYTALNIAAYKLIGVTMTVPGIAGFILSIGMAVDANILVLERLRESLRQGRQLLPAIQEAFREAWRSIRDSNISTLITCILLYVLGASIVRGFALTLGVGVLLSMFSAVTVSRILLRACAMTRGVNAPRLYGAVSSAGPEPPVSRP